MNKSPEQRIVESVRKSVVETQESRYSHTFEDGAEISLIGTEHTGPVVQITNPSDIEKMKTVLKQEGFDLFPSPDKESIVWVSCFIRFPVLVYKQVKEVYQNML